MIKSTSNKVFTLLSFLFITCSCDNSIESETSNEGSYSTLNITADLPSVYTKIYNASDVYLKGNFVIIQVNGAPDHKSPYFNSSDNLYEAYSGSNSAFKLNPNKIASFDFTYSIPLNPSPATGLNRIL